MIIFPKVNYNYIIFAKSYQLKFQSEESWVLGSLSTDVKHQSKTVCIYVNVEWELEPGYSVYLSDNMEGSPWCLHDTLE